jgi:hypothetical protein
LRIWQAVIDELMGKGLASAKQVARCCCVFFLFEIFPLSSVSNSFFYIFQAILSGCSAGGLAALLHCNDFHARFPKEVSAKCLPDAGFFLDV